MNQSNTHYISLIHLAESKKSIIEVLKAGKIQDRNITITESMLDDFVSNFNEGVYGTDIQVNLGHNRDGEAAGWITKLIKEGDTLFAEVEWTPLGIEKIKNKQYRFTSSELAFEHTHPETGKKIKNVFIGVALTNIPAVKGMQPVTLSEEAQIYINNPNNMAEETKEEIVVEPTDSENTEKETEEKEETKEELAEDEKAMTPEEKEKMKKKMMKQKEMEKEKLSEKSQVVSLTEFTKLQEELSELKFKQDLIELNQEVENTMMLSEKNKLGFAKNNIDEVASFMVNLSQDQREQFTKIVSMVRTVDLSINGTDEKGNNSELSQEDQIIVLSDKLLKEGKAKDIFEAQKMASESINQ